MVVAKAVNRLLCLLALLITLATGPSTAKGQPQLLKAEVLHLPKKTTIAGKPWIYYEVYLTNLSSDSIDLQRMEITGTDNKERLLLLENPDQFKKLSNGRGKGNRIAPESSIILYFELALNGSKKSRRIQHHLNYFRSAAKTGYSLRFSLPVTQQRSIALGAPLQGGPWVAVYDPRWENGHRRVVFPAGGKQKIPGRFAIDFVKVDDSGRFARGNSDSISNWFGYKAAVLAVSDGIVAAVKSDFKESPTLSAHPDYPADQATGNYISLKLADSVYAFYEHLLPGSIKVRPGDKVKKGQVIAALGFTGQSTGPHLHFHLADQNSALNAEGIPFVFEAFEVLGAYTDFNHFGTKPWKGLPKGHKSLTGKERPEPNGVLNFRLPN